MNFKEKHQSNQSRYIIFYNNYFEYFDQQSFCRLKKVTNKRNSKYGIFFVSYSNVIL